MALSGHIRGGLRTDGEMWQHKVLGDPAGAIAGRLSSKNWLEREGLRSVPVEGGKVEW